MADYLIIGSGISAASAIRAIRELDATGSIVVITDDPDRFYFRSALPRYLLQEVADRQLVMLHPEDLKNMGVEVIHDMARSIDFLTRVVTTMTGRTTSFGKLLIATGSSPTLSYCEGRNLSGVFTFRSLANARELGRRMQRGAKCVIIGAGVLGLDAAWCAAACGVSVTLLHQQNRIGHPVLDDKAAAFVLKAVKKAGVKVVPDDEVESFYGVDDRLLEVRTKGKKNLPCDFAVVCTGTVPNLELLRRTDVEITNAVIVNRRMATNLEEVYAAGDVCAISRKDQGPPLKTRHWFQAALQGRTAGYNMAGRDTVYMPGTFFDSGLFFNVPYSLYGFYNASGNNYTAVDVSTDDSVIRRLVFKEKKLIGAIILGEQRNYPHLMDLIESKLNMELEPGRLLDPIVVDELSV